MTKKLRQNIPFNCGSEAIHRFEVYIPSLINKRTEQARGIYEQEGNINAIA
jgi:hypothetical protein